MKHDGMIFRRAPHVSYRVASNYVLPYYSKSGKSISIDGHSKTNMAYGTDGRVWLVLDGRVYVSGRVSA